MYQTEWQLQTGTGSCAMASSATSRTQDVVCIRFIQTEYVLKDSSSFPVQYCSISKLVNLTVQTMRMIRTTSLNVPARPPKAYPFVAVIMSPMYCELQTPGRRWHSHGNKKLPPHREKANERLSLRQHPLISAFEGNLYRLCQITRVNPYKPVKVLPIFMSKTFLGSLRWTGRCVYATLVMSMSKLLAKEN